MYVCTYVYMHIYPYFICLINENEKLERNITEKYKGNMTVFYGVVVVTLVRLTNSLLNHDTICNWSNAIKW